MPRQRKDFGATTTDGKTVGHCGPRSIAGALADKARASLFVNADDTRLIPLISMFEQMFPQLVNHINGYDMDAKATTKFTLLSQQINESTFVASMGSALRYAVANECQQHPYHYQGSFVTEGTITVDHDMHPNQMRLDKTYIDESFISAAASIVGPITVHSSRLRSARTYNQDAVIIVASSDNTLSINHEGNHYTANVYDPTSCASKVTAARSAIRRTSNSNLFKQASDAELQQRFQQDEQIDRQRQFDAATLLHSLTVAALLDLYTTLRADVAKRDGDSYLTGRPKEITRERSDNIIACILENPSLANTMLDEDAELRENVYQELLHVLSVEAYRSKASFQFIQNNFPAKLNSDSSDNNMNQSSSNSLTPTLG